VGTTPEKLHLGGGEGIGWITKAGSSILVVRFDNTESSGASVLPGARTAQMRRPTVMIETGA